MKNQPTNPQAPRRDEKTGGVQKKDPQRDDNAERRPGQSPQRDHQ